LSCDVVVVGAGPAGSSAARESAKAGYRTIIFEEDPVVGVPIQCGEGLSIFALQNLNINPSKEFISQEIGILRVIFPNDNFMFIREKGFELNRDKFDQFLASRAIDNGAELYTSTKVVGFDLKTKKITYRQNGNTKQISAKIIIGADGPKSNIANWSGLLDKEKWVKGLVRAYEYRIRGVNVDGFDMYFLPEMAPGGYLWVFKKAENLGNVGIATTATDSVQRLHKFMGMKKITGKVEKIVAGSIPGVGPLERTYADGVMIAGDAAGHTNPVFLGGIHCAMLGGRLAGQTAVEALEAEDASARFLAKYEKKWRSLPLANASLIKTAEIMQNSSQKQWNKIGKLVGELDVTDFNNMGKAKIILKTLLPQYWSLLPLTIHMPTVMKGFSITQRWGW
jgi:digeranylgeranylglycerophospholipid reductase